MHVKQLVTLLKNALLVCLEYEFEIMFFQTAMDQACNTCLKIANHCREKARRDASRTRHSHKNGESARQDEVADEDDIIDSNMHRVI